ncbi:cell division cycle 20.2, cofactor of APC complex-like [Quillaja saponaria]|uniref:Cell division cycle 20.2, cofactor of APC complex-like n=1 Tax=Quillaja saponaria TaxID=32244 RepID=A0AAD7VGP3_QUISA|nr:cell division cycle 20.2, cofactor of APC complex-like [Quillaja saponaria]
MSKVQCDWYSPTRLSSPSQYDFPGDRFIPNRSLMDLDQAQSLLTNRTRRVQNTEFNELYRQKVEEKLTLDSEGRPFRMLVFRGSPKSCRKSIRHIDEMREEEALALENNTKPNTFRRLPKKEARILDAPNLRNDFYLNAMDWGKNNVLAVALGSELYLWNSENGKVSKLLQVSEGDYITSVAWSEDAKFVAVGYMHSKLQLWDAETSKLVRVLEGHNRRVATVAWNSHTLTSGSQDHSIINHDVKAGNDLICRVQAHTEEVCGLKWSRTGNVLASGGNENHIYIWDFKKMSSCNFLYCFNEHRAAVKALAWCPYQSDVLASGGGTKDGCIKIWNAQRGTCISSIDTEAQVCGLEWNRHHKELLSGHGFSTSEHQNQLCLWKYPSMTKVGDLKRHASRILHLSQSPDGLTVVSAGADETLRFWEVFGPRNTDTSGVSDLDNLLSLKISPIR